MLVSNLVPTSGQKDFYGKAVVITKGGTTYLKSYETIVASYDVVGFHRHWLGWSLTTAKHINSFRASFGDGAISKYEWFRFPVVDCNI